MIKFETQRERLTKLIATTCVTGVLAFSLTACGSTDATAENVQVEASEATEVQLQDTSADNATPSGPAAEVEAQAAASSATEANGEGALDTSDMFSDRDLEQEADTSNATEITLTSNENVTITEEGVYVITGSAENCTIVVAADDAAKVQLVLDGVTIVNDDAAAIYVASCDKVFVTTTDTENTLEVTGTFSTEDETASDAAVFSKSDLVLNGIGTLNVTSTDNGISGHDDLKITGGTYNITSEADAVEGHDSIRICDGTFTIHSGKDGFHSEDSDDDTVGYVYISGGTFDITAADDGIQATTVNQIDGGTFAVSAVEGIEGTYVQINGGAIDIEASDDGINATGKSTAYDIVLEINGGETTIVMAQGDTDALDSNGNLVITGGTVDITANSPFDYDYQGVLEGGTVIVNGEQVTELTSAMMGGDMGGRMPGGDMGGAPGDMGGRMPGELAV
ncbi:carbohydrate-binding domain-containing protein [Slackia heliotrinireducens]|uniref:carbohydrate-binding domain-containing protein n=1 Tax=Slackia heliotrinireducens TaxID=84110 RepID=UPI003315A128